MTGIAIRDGKAVMVDGKAVIGDCYCDCSSECPNCCLTINWGAFDGSGDLFQTFANLTVTLVMPTKNSRIVCDNEMVTVRLEFTLPDPAAEGDFKPFVRWDRAWEWFSNSPDVDPVCGIVIEEGLVEWCDLSFDPNPPGDLLNTYEVVLKYNQCWADSGLDFGDIEAGDRDGDFAVITGAYCGSASCCTPLIDCAPCCFFIDQTNDANGYELNDAGEPVFWRENAQGDRMMVVVRGMDPETLTICIGPTGDSTIKLVITLIPARYDIADPWFPELGVSATDWLGSGHTPPEGTGSFDYGPPVSVIWGADVSALRYEVDMSVPCPKIPGDISVGFTNGSDGTVDGASLIFFWSCCPEDPADCENCYPALIQQNYKVCFGQIGPYFEDPADPPLPDCGEFYYIGRVRDTVGSCDGSFAPDGYYYYGMMWLLRACFASIEEQDAYEALLVALVPFNYSWVNDPGPVAIEKPSCLSTPYHSDICDPEASGFSPDNVEDVFGDNDSVPPDCPECMEDC